MNKPTEPQRPFNYCVFNIFRMLKSKYAINLEHMENLQDFPILYIYFGFFHNTLQNDFGEENILDFNHVKQSPKLVLARNKLKL